MFLKDKILPQDIMLQQLEQENCATIPDYVKGVLEKQKYCHELVERNLEVNEAEYVEKHNKTAKTAELLEGQRVYVESVVPPGKAKKLYKKYSGPFRVMEILGNERFRLKDLETGKEKEVHANRIKPVVETEKKKKGRKVSTSESEVAQDSSENESEDEEWFKGNRFYLGKKKGPTGKEKSRYNLRKLPAKNYKTITRE